MQAIRMWNFADGKRHLIRIMQFELFAEQLPALSLVPWLEVEIGPMRGTYSIVINKKLLDECERSREEFKQGLPKLDDKTIEAEIEEYEETRRVLKLIDKARKATPLPPDETPRRKLNL